MEELMERMELNKRKLRAMSYLSKNYPNKYEIRPTNYRHGVLLLEKFGGDQIGVLDRFYYVSADELIQVAKEQGSK